MSFLANKSLMRTAGAIPIIRCPKGGAAEMIAAKLDRKLRDHILNSKDNLFSSQGQRPSSAAGTPASRPVLIIVDRNIDLIPMLSHSWTYQSLVHDVLKMRLNRITVQTLIDEDNPSKGSKERAYDLNSSDFFWSRNAGVPFPQVAEDIDVELTKYKEESSEITKKSGKSSIEDLDASDTSSTAMHMKAVIAKIPELRERKAILDMHMNIATALLSGIKNRQLDNFFQIEENITKQTKAQILELLNDEAKGKESLDKLRLFIIWFLSTEQELSRADMDRFEEALKSAGCDVTPLAYVKRLVLYTSLSISFSTPFPVISLTKFPCHLQCPRNNTHDNDDLGPNTTPSHLLNQQRALPRFLLHLQPSDRPPPRRRSWRKFREPNLWRQKFPSRQ